MLWILDMILDYVIDYEQGSHALNFNLLAKAYQNATIHPPEPSLVSIMLPYLFDADQNSLPT